MKNKLTYALTLAVITAMLVTSLALADNLKDDAAASGNDTFTAGGSTTIKYWIQPIGACDASDGSSATVTINVPAGVTASPSSLTFTACNTGSEGSPNNTQNVTLSSSTAADYSISASVSDSSGSYNTSPANFTLHVLAPPPPSDSTPPVISYVLNPAAPDGDNGWYKSNVTLTWTVSDPESSFTTTGCLDQSITADQAVTTYSCSASSAGGDAGPVDVSIKRDATAPTISGSPSSAPNLAGWYNSDVTLLFTCGDGLSGIASCSAGQTLTGDGANQSVTGNAVDNAGNTASATVSGINIDKTAPTATATAAPAANANGWNNTDVTVSFSGSDGLSGIYLCDAAVVLSAEGAGQSASGACTDKAGNVSASATASGINIDKTKPTVSLVGGPSDGGSYYFGSVPAAPACSASDTLSGLDGSCAVSGYSALVGSHTVTASATDKAGNSSSTSASYTVLAWTLNGFFQPVDMNGVFNVVKNGSTVPFKFEIFAGTTEITDVAAVESLKYGPVACNATAPVDAIETTATGGTSLRYDTIAGQFVYNWKTPTTLGCLSVTMKTDDGSTLVAYFKLK